MQDATEILAKKLFKEKYPYRFWSLVATPRRVGVEISSHSATEAERARFHALADARLRRKETETKS